jgi:Flp pilus assembly protein TadG
MTCRRPRLSFRASLADERASAAVEFSLLLPAFCLLLVGTIDLGGVLLTKLRLNQAVSAGANYAIVNAASVGSSGGASLASTIAGILSTSNAVSTTTGSVVVNNGPTATVTTSSTTSSGTAANADLYYCPTLSGTTLTWGTGTSAKGTCTGGVPSGKFVQIVAQQSYSPVFSGYGLVQSGTISSRAVVQVQ